MQNIARANFNRLVVLVGFFLTLQSTSSFAQSAPTITASWATQYARYYAPYALQAAAAYLSVGDFNSHLSPQGEPALDGSDVTLAISPSALDPTTVGRATKSLRAW